MDAAYLSALSALAGSVVGGLISGVTTWLSQRSQMRAGQLAREMSRREGLYKDFTHKSNEPRISDLLYLYAMISRMRILCLPRTVACAEKIMYATVDTYFAPNKSSRERHELMKSGAGIDPLKEFSEVARDELSAFTTL